MADDKGKGETDQVEDSPGPEPGDSGNAEVQEGIIAEQCHMAAAAGGGEHRSKEASRSAEHRQGAGVLKDCQNCGETATATRTAKAKDGGIRL